MESVYFKLLKDSFGNHERVEIKMDLMKQLIVEISQEASWRCSFTRQNYIENLYDENNPHNTLLITFFNGTAQTH